MIRKTSNQQPQADRAIWDRQSISPTLSAMNSTITQLDTAESALLTGYTLNVSHNQKRAELYRAGDAKSLPLRPEARDPSASDCGPLFKEDPV